MRSSISLRCDPGSKRPGLTVENGIVRLRVRERAVEGAANRACVRALAEALRVAPSSVTLTSGVRSREKRFTIEGLAESELRSRLGL